MTTHGTPFEKTILRNLFEAELDFLAFDVIRNGGDLFRAFPPQDAPTLAIDGDHEFLGPVFAALSSAAKINELLWPPKNQPLNLVRAQHLCGLLASIQLPEIQNKKVRNSVEHFGENLDDWNGRLTHIKGVPSFAVFCNGVLGIAPRCNAPALPFPVYDVRGVGIAAVLVRVYVSGTQSFHNFNESIDIRALVDEAQAIRSALAPRRRAQGAPLKPTMCMTVFVGDPLAPSTTLRPLTKWEERL